MAVAVVIEWFGPYASKDQLHNSIKMYPQRTKCLYMAIGGDGLARYVGRTEDPSDRLLNHEKMDEADQNGATFYCGHIVSQGVGGRRNSVCRTDLSSAEHALIAALKPELNTSLKERELSDCVVVYSRFWDFADENRRIPAPEGFPPIIAYDSWTKQWDHPLPSSRASPRTRRSPRHSRGR